MGHQKKAAAAAMADEEVHVPLQAVLLADSFTQKFRPITLEKPKVLLPLANIPMIEYTLSWLESVGAEEIFVFCCAHAKQVREYLDRTQWLGQARVKVTVIEANNSISAGDALRAIYEKNVIHGDFVLVSGDTVSNMPLKEAMQRHKERKKKDPLSVMTMVVKQSKPSRLTNQTRLGTDELFMGIDPESSQLLYYEDRADYTKGMASIDKTLISEKLAVRLYNDMQDCYIDICSLEVLSLFTDNFDYQHLRRDFVKGLLLDEIMGYKIFTYELQSSYAARIENFRSYDTVSKDILQRWLYPLVPDVQFSGNCPPIQLDRNGIYTAPDVLQSPSAKVSSLSLVGGGTVIGDHSVIINSVVGQGCTIGSNVYMEGSYIWNNVIIQDNTNLRNCMICDGVTVKSGSVLEPGVILSFKVMIGPEFMVPAYSKISLFDKPISQNSDEELEYIDSSHRVPESPDNSSTDMLDDDDDHLDPPYKSAETSWDTSKVGDEGAGILWSNDDDLEEEEWKQSVAPIPVDKLNHIMSKKVELEEAQDTIDVPAFEGVNVINTTLDDADVSTIDDDMEDDDDDHPDSQASHFQKEVEETFRRAVVEVPGVEQEHIILEINALRLAETMSFSDCAGAVFYSLTNLALEDQHSNHKELFLNFKKVISKWKDLLRHYLQSEDEEVEILLKLEEICLDFGKEFAPLFSQILSLLYNEDIISEEAIMSWASEKEEAEESDKIFLKQSETFIQWLREASEEE